MKKKIGVIIGVIILALVVGAVAYFVPRWKSSEVLFNNADMVHFTFDAEIDLKQENLDGQVKETIDNIAFLLGRTEKDLCELNIKGNVYENKIFAEIYPEDATEPVISFYLSEDQRIINASPFIKAYRDKIAEVVSATPLLKNMLPEVPDELYLTTEQVEGLFGVDLSVLDHFGYNMSPLTLSRFECFAELLFLEREETKAVSTYKWESEHIDAEIDIPHTESPVIVEKLSIENPVDTIHAIEDKLKAFKIQIPEEGLDVIDEISIEVYTGQGIEIIFPELSDMAVLDAILKVKDFITGLSSK